MPGTRGVRLTLACLALALAGCRAEGGVSGGAPEAAETCDRQCLLVLAASYIDALTAHDPSAAPLASGAVLVENLRQIRIGEGLWRTAGRADTDYAIPVADEALQQIGWIGLIEVNGNHQLLALRLKVEGGLIVEAEHLAVLPMQGFAANLSALRPEFGAAIPLANRLDRAQLLEIGASYYDALDENDGARTPFAADCQLISNGIITAGAGAIPPQGVTPTPLRTATDCPGQINSQVFTYIDRIENRRMIAADPVTGLVMGFAQFRHSMRNLPYRVTLADGTIAERTRTNLPYDPFDLAAAHIFKIGPDGQIHQIETVGLIAPLNAPNGWE